MGDMIRSMVGMMLKGFRDSIVGFFTVYHMNKDTSGEDDSDVKSSPSRETSLARRRAERMTHASTTSAKPRSQPKVFHRILLCCAWNGGIFWLSILLFNQILIPGLEFFIHYIFGGSSTYHAVWSYTGPILTWTFRALWIMPLFLLSKVVNSFWFQDIADAAYRKSRGRPQFLPTLSRNIADILFSVLLQCLFLIQAMLSQKLPIGGIGMVVHIVHMCLLYSLYAFEYKWFNMGWEVHKRLSYIECNWPYFVGFGLPLAILTSVPSSHIVSGCVFSIVFPLYIVSANEAEPLQQLFEFPLALFSPVVSVCNVIFQQSVKKGGVSMTTASGASSSSASSGAKRVTIQDSVR